MLPDELAQEASASLTTAAEALVAEAASAVPEPASPIPAPEVESAPKATPTADITATPQAEPSLARGPPPAIMCDLPIAPALWKDPDVRWLTGVREAEGHAYVVHEPY